MKGNQLSLDRVWMIGDQIGHGGFGKVYAASSGEEEAVAKFVPKAPGADRELLFVNLSDARNVVPIIDSGEHKDYWVLIMPRAESSLREHLDKSGGSLVLQDAVDVVKDICDALADLDGRVVHRDLKPENILRLNGRWCLADFGISRYAAATTAPDTQKFALSPPYAAPERWRSERATAATDIYAVGVMTYEMLAGSRPFHGPSAEQFREQHLHVEPPHLEDVPPAFGAVVDECLYKAAEARPTAANFRTRLDRIVQGFSQSAGLARLEEANRAAVRRKSDASRQQSEARTEAERRAGLTEAAEQSFDRISVALRDNIAAAAPTAALLADAGRAWSFSFDQANLLMSAPERHRNGDWSGWDAPAFDVICYASLNLGIPANHLQYQGRSHSLWFADIQQAGNYCWFETAFMLSAFIPKRGRQNPFALDPGEEAAKAVGPGMNEYLVAWPFTPLVVGELDEFIDRWAGWFADAADGRLVHPSTMPERDTEGSWRR